MYHGCELVNEDGTRALILREKSKFATANPFWKLPEHVGSKMETRMMEMRKKTATKKDIKKYFQTINQ